MEEGHMINRVIYQLEKSILQANLCENEDLEESYSENSIYSKMFYGSIEKSGGFEK